MSLPRYIPLFQSPDPYRSFIEGDLEKRAKLLLRYGTFLKSRKPKSLYYFYDKYYVEVFLMGRSIRYIEIISDTNVTASYVSMKEIYALLK